MNKLREYYHRETLKNAAEVTIRAVRNNDQNLLVVALRASERRLASMHSFGDRSAMCSNEPGRFAGIDSASNVTLLVTIDTAQSEFLIGFGSYQGCAPSDGWPTAQVAFVVEKDFQGIGIASRLLTHLTRIARCRGVTQFDAEVLTANRPMLNVFANSGLPMRRRVDGDTEHVSLMLSIGRVGHSPPSEGDVLIPRFADQGQRRTRPSVALRET